MTILVSRPKNVLITTRAFVNILTSRLSVLPLHNVDYIHKMQSYSQNPAVMHSFIHNIHICRQLLIIQGYGLFSNSCFCIFFSSNLPYSPVLFTVVDNPVDNPNILIYYMLITGAYFQLTGPWRMIFAPDEAKFYRNSGPYFQKFQPVWHKKRRQGTFRIVFKHAPRCLSGKD